MPIEIEPALSFKKPDFKPLKLKGFETKLSYLIKLNKLTASLVSEEKDH